MRPYKIPIQVGLRQRHTATHEEVLEGLGSGAIKRCWTKVRVRARACVCMCVCGCGCGCHCLVVSVSHALSRAGWDAEEAAEAPCVEGRERVSRTLERAGGMGDESATEMLDKLLAEEGVPPADAGGGGDEMSGDSQKLKNYADLMKKVPLLRSLTEEEQLKIAALLKPKEFEDGENIITQGEEGDCMYFIQSGEVRRSPRASLLSPRQHTPVASPCPSAAPADLPDPRH